MRKKTLSIIIFLLFLCTYSYSQVKKLSFITVFDLQSWTLLDDFEFTKINNWELSTTTKEADLPKVDDNSAKSYLKKVETSLAFGAMKGERFLTESYMNNKYCLGIKVLFPELHRVSSFVKPKENFKINGYCKKIALWLLGRGRDVDFNVVVKDYLNRMYTIPITKLNFTGWQYFEVNVPLKITQSFNTFPKRTIEVAGFLLINNPSRYAEEVYQPFYVYVDGLEVLMDQNIDYYPGVEISDDW